MEIVILTIADLGKLFVSCIPVGFLLGFIPMLIGAVIHGIFRIFKQV